MEPASDSFKKEQDSFSNQTVTDSELQPVLPEGLDEYEFLRNLSVSRDMPNLFHFIPVLHPETYKPQLTADGQPDKKPFQWKEFFASDKPLHIEIGCGKGNFLVEYATRHPEINILGAEWEPKIAHYAALRLQRNALENGAVLRGDFFFFLRDCIPTDSVDTFHMYFPDPWPKKRHHKNRLAIKAGFFEEIRRVLKPGNGLFYWGTDHAEYNEAAQEHFAQLPFVKVLEKDTAEPTDGIQTNFEKKYRREGRPIYRSVLEIQC